jgi:hypothetical protein
VKNWYDFLNLNDVAEGGWRLTADGAELQRGSLPPLDLAPRASKRIAVPVKPFVPEPGREYFLGELPAQIRHPMGEERS